ncbi:hypothetical protein D9615_008131 [Tricholomella constricta]|uniref:Uncharacterized protein n=1 Tax=Tricholomella constricta TaxID=117010 RepID=A0A8H5GWB0_9AGAR|nr:hypothetical protein D9615_008131 [Tricholomella constricta]
MPSISSSIKLTEIFDSLPPEAQRTLVEKHLFPLLDSIPKEKSDHVISVASEFKTRLQPMPKLDLKSKKKEVNFLMQALSRDAKTAMTKERSNREELLAEVVDSLTDWLSDIWSVVYEFRDSYLQAHVCLLFVADVSTTLADLPGLGGCKCSLLNMPIDITIRKQNGKVMKSFSLRGPHTIHKALLWIWRELFVSLSAYGTSSAKRRMPEMIEDLEAILSWRALESLLYGGKTYRSSNILGDYDDGEEFDDTVHNTDEEEDDDDYIDEDDEDDGEYDGLDLSCTGCSCPFHAKHWPDFINDQRLHLRELVENRLHANYRSNPSLLLYQVICSISNNVTATKRTLLRETNENATKSADTIVGALEVYIRLTNTNKIAGLLDTHYHLLRSRDAEVLQKAVRALASSNFSVHTIQIMAIVEQELLECIRAIHAAVSAIFGNHNLPVHKSELEGILKLRVGTQERNDRANDWVEAAMTLGSPMNPMAIAAMMMGLPFGLPFIPMEDGGHEDVTAFLDDVDTSDPDFEEVNAEFRPKLRDRFEGWYKLIERLKEPAAPSLLGTMYIKIVELMPFMRGADIVDRMVLRLSEIQGKSHIGQGLHALSNFCIIQRKKVSANVLKQRRASERASAGSQDASPTSFGNPSAPFSFSFLPQPSQPSSHPPFGGMEDVD